MTNTPESIEQTKHPRQCVAHKTNGDPCTRWAIAGGTVCPAHGGSRPAVKRNARQRLLDLVDPALGALSEIVNSAEKDADKLRAVENILDRAGHGRQQTVQVEDARAALEARLAELEE